MPKKPALKFFQSLIIIALPVLFLAALVLLAYQILKPKPHAPVYSAADVAGMNAGIGSLQTGDYAAAIQSFSAVIRSEPAYGQAYNNRGLAYQANGESTLAMADFKQAVKLLPNDPTPYNNRGSIYFSQGDFENAMKDFNQALARDSEFAKAYYNRGAIYLSLGENDKAIAEFDKAIQFTPEITATQVTPTQPITTSLELADAASQRYANLPVTYAQRGSAYIGIGDYEKAFQDLNKALTLKPDLSMAFYYRGLAYYAQGDYVRAIPQFTNVLELNNDPELVKMATERLTEIGNK